jgi:hypothetical protein
MEKAKPIINFRLVGIKVEQFALIENHFQDGVSLSLNTNLDVKVDLIERRLGVFMTFDLFQSEHLLLKLEVSCHFNIDEESWGGLLNQQKIRFPNDFVIHLIMLTLGTARGIFFSKTEGTILSRFILPMLDIRKMFGEGDIELELNQSQL